MSATDVPLHAGLGGRPVGEFVARPAARRLASFAARWVVLASGATMGLASRHPWSPAAAKLVVAALMFSGFTAVGLAVRRARVAIDSSGVRWGWASLGFRLHRDRLRRVDVYRDAIAMRPRRGSTWFLTAWDWDRFDALVLAVERSGLAVTRVDRAAPLGARLQSYGRVLDGLLVLAVLGATITAVLAATL